MIRRATPMDESIIYDFIVELEENQLDKTTFSGIYHANLHNPQVLYYVYEDGNNVVGFISIHIQQLLHHNSNVAEIHELFVAKDARNFGIGTKLFQTAVEVSKEYQCTQLEVCCNQRRVTSHKFYENQGMGNHHYKFSIPIRLE